MIALERIKEIEERWDSVEDNPDFYFLLKAFNVMRSLYVELEILEHASTDPEYAKKIEAWADNEFEDRMSGKPREYLEPR